jgi:phosphotriesterase-related protein
MSVNTLRGEVAPGALGFTLMHEHLFMLSVGLYERWPHLLDRAEITRVVTQKVEAAREAGVDTIVEMTTPNMGRDLALLQAVAENSSVNIVAATGAHPHETLPLYLRGEIGDSADGVDSDRLADLFAYDIEVGMDGTNVKAGIIKTGSDPLVDETNARLLRAAARAHLRTGVPISTHTHAAHKVGLEQQDIFASEGVGLDRIVIGHCGDSSDLHYLSALAERGSYLGMDRFGFTLPGRPPIPVAERVNMVAELCRRGYARRIVLSSDSISWSEVISEGYFSEHLPDWNLVYVPNVVIDLLREAGVDDMDIQLMMRVNPAQILNRS